MNATQTHAALECIKALADAIKSLGSVPSGTLYAGLMGKLSLDQYNAMIGILTKSGLVHLSTSHVLTWKG